MNLDYMKGHYKGLTKVYFDWISNKLIKMGDLENEKGLILDFGCGFGRLKKLLPNCNIVGYDIMPKFSEVDDYRDLKPTKIVFSSVLEHVSLKDIEKILKEFPKSELLVFLPTENIFSKIAMILSNQSHAHDDHISKYKDINHLIEKSYDIKERKYLFFRMAQLTRYIAKP